LEVEGSRSVPSEWTEPAKHTCKCEQHVLEAKQKSLLLQSGNGVFRVKDKAFLDLLPSFKAEEGAGDFPQIN
jgi:hypothetical protein